MLPKFIQFSAVAVDYSEKSIALLSGSVQSANREFLPKSQIRTNVPPSETPSSVEITIPCWLWLKLKHTEYYGEPVPCETING